MYYIVKMKKEGFTLVELLVAISIIVILSSIAFVGYGQRQKEIALQKEANLLISKVEEVKEKAISSKYFHNNLPAGGYGLYFNIASPDSYLVFADCDGDGRYDQSGKPCFDPHNHTYHSEFIERISFENKVYIKSLPPWLSITFKPPSPSVSIYTPTGQINQANLILGIEGSPKEKTIYFNSSGLVYVE